MEKTLSGAEIRELREDVLNSTSAEKEKMAKIIFDGRQFSIRFPKKFIDEAEVNVDKDQFKIELKIPEYASGEKPTLTATLIHKNEKEKETNI